MTDTTIRRIVGNRVHTPCFVITFIVLVLWTFYCANHAYPQTAPCGVTIQQICACNGKVYDPHLKPVPGCVKPPAAPEPEKVCRVTTQFQDTAVVGDWLPCSAAYLAVMNSRGDVKAWISDGPKSVPVPLAAPEPQAKPLENIAPSAIPQGLFGDRVRVFNPRAPNDMIASCLVRAGKLKSCHYIGKHTLKDVIQAWADSQH